MPGGLLDMIPAGSLLCAYMHSAVERTAGPARGWDYDQVSDWKRWDRSKAARYSSASEEDRPPSRWNTVFRASATPAGISLAFLEEKKCHYCVPKTGEHGPGSLL